MKLGWANEIKFQVPYKLRYKNLQRRMQENRKDPEITVHEFTVYSKLLMHYNNLSN